VGSRLAESPPAAAHPKNAPAAVMPSPPSPAGAEGRAEAAAAHPDTARRCPPPAGATTPCRAEPDEAAAAAPTPVAVPKSSHAEGSASHAEGSASHAEGSATSHGEGSATSHGEAPATAMANAAGPCEATAVRPTAAHGRRIQSQAANGNRRGCQPNRYLAKHHDAQLLCCEHPSLCESNSSIVIGLQWMVPPFRNSPHWPALQHESGAMVPIDRCQLAAVFKPELPALIGSPG
jgi:hypothetical protein